MFVFVSGGARSGKSEWAEAALLALADEAPRVYLATAMVTDEDMRRRVARHRALRQGRGFLTVERPRGLDAILPVIPRGAAVLLECLPNWLANEMFGQDMDTQDMNENDEGLVKVAKAPKVKEEIFRVTQALRARCRHLVVVSDDVFADGVRYDGTTEAYLRLLGELHVLLAHEADVAVECVAGVARFAKGVLA